MLDLTLIRTELETALDHLVKADGAELDFATFARLDLARKAIQSADRALGRELAEGDEAIQNALMNAGFASVRLDDPPATISVGGQLWAGVDYRHRADCLECDWSIEGGKGYAEDGARSHEAEQRHKVRMGKETTDAGYARALNALERAGMGQFAQRRFDSKVLSAHFREICRDDPDFELPTELVGAIKLTETMKVKVTKRTR